MSVFVIAEAGVNHNGRKNLALELIDAAVYAKADAVKFQTFKAKNIVTRNAAKAQYQKQTTNSNDSQYEMLKQLELSFETFFELKQYCENRGIEFLSTAFDSDSLVFLADDLKLARLKIPSGEITNGPLLLAHARKRCDVILSTGMATLGEIEDALGVIAFGLICGEKQYTPPSRSEFKKAFVSAEGQQLLKDHVTLLHCTTEYPAPEKEVNLNVLKTMQSAFGLKVGYSDHSEGLTVPIAAAVLGAEIIEKHFTVDKQLPGPDHKASLEPEELARMVSAIRSVEVIMGSGQKTPAASEIINKKVARKSIVAVCAIKKGELFSPDNITTKRPGTGRSPMEYWDLLGTKSRKDYMPDEMVI